VHFLILGGSPVDRDRAARSRAAATHSLVVLDAATLPFTRVEKIALPPSPRAVLVHDLERAFPDNQTGGTRLVLTQSTYLLQKWIDRIEDADLIVASADRAAFERNAPEAFQQRGPWRAFQVVEIDGDSCFGIRDSQRGGNSPAPAAPNPTSQIPNPIDSVLARAYAVSDPAERLRLCREAVARDPDSAVAHLALASAYREHRDLAARDALERAAALAPEWEAVHYESGKLWLALDDIERARDAFRRAADLMPAFSAALSNLGATLGELDRPDAALAAFEQALAHDPRSVTLLNNVGVVCRELGRLDASEAAFRRLIEIAPEFVFGHYNLGHTLFLAGRYAEALDAYLEGQRRDPEKSLRQACRLAIVRFATGDVAGAERELLGAASAAPQDEREDLLLEAYEIAHALMAQDPARGADAAQLAFLERLGSQITKSE
jgi:tetratricopeptide (TPR) repeat protein